MNSNQSSCLDATSLKAQPKTVKPAKSLLRQTGRALVDYAMINAGDRLLLGVSGGKDSLSLLQILKHFQRHAPIDFKLGVVTVDPEVEGFHPQRLKTYMAEQGIEYFYRQQPIMESAKQNMKGDSFCAYCARMKRGIMYTTAREAGYNVLVLAQHLDDLAESFLMSAFFGGQLKTMKANYTIDAGDLRVIRPLVYVRERQLRDFAQQAALPIILDSCPACFSAPTQREAMKQLLAAQEKSHPHLFKNLLHTMRPLMMGFDPADLANKEGNNHHV
ncbi:tRNA 2-thiocytidine biosynthesis TtcA family protein [Candidatus Venteria ishoeyi]|uniref:tRNA 2-thiocytidine biosynthesis protein TtcA n=1 Tax=Candidatus Venteria ishoeyi TaxID=1899563 RepID=A0A1H6FDH4_9GAMM|nr:ATP-binding protein [Candidatus Venteria ishoeyi]MDM8547084.1 ATP-binding protein [Candidatus Venteria ishoeyi]SEH07703.1 tRNA 2-thiocytidine biosynthesis protein TtcA [Candidatus Venteria ishoeyi]